MHAMTLLEEHDHEITGQIERQLEASAGGQSEFKSSSSSMEPDWHQNHTEWMAPEAKLMVELISYCRLCAMVLVDPVQSACGHVYCKACILKHLELRSDCPELGFDCPRSICNASVKESDLTRSPLVERVLKYGMRYKCPDCKEQLRDPADHVQRFDCARACDEGVRACKKRSWATAKHLDDHSRQCGNAFHICEACSKRVLRKDMNDHLAGCWTAWPVKRRFIWLAAMPKTCMVLTVRGVRWTLLCKTLADGSMQMALSLDKAEMQADWKDVFLAAHISKMRVDLYHPLTGDLVVSKDKPDPFYCYAEYDSDGRDWFTVCVEDERKSIGVAHDWDVEVSFVVDRLWDCHQRNMGKRQKTEPVVASVVVKAGEVKQQAPDAPDAQAVADPVVEVIVAQ